MPSHRRPGKPPPGGPDPQKAPARTTSWVGTSADRIVLLISNGGARLGLLLNSPRTSPAMLVLAGWGGLRLWAAVFLAAAALISTGKGSAGNLPGPAEIGYLFATVGWTLLGCGATYGVVTATSSSPSASVAFAAVSVSVALRHGFGLAHWASRRRAARR